MVRNKGLWEPAGIGNWYRFVKAEDTEMPSKKPIKQVKRFTDAASRFSELLATLSDAEIFDTAISSRSGKTTIKIKMKTKDGNMPATKVAKLGERMAQHFHAFFTPTYYEKYEIFTVRYVRGEGYIQIEGRI